MLHCPISKTYVYKKAFAQSERGGKTWRVVTDTVKHPNGIVEAKLYEPSIPSKSRVATLAKILNTCTPHK